MKSSLSLSYKETGVTGGASGTTPVSPQEIASDICRDGKPGTVFGRISLISTVDPRIEDKAHRILCLIAACAWKRRAPLSFAEIAKAVDCSERTVMRHISALEECGYLDVARSHNKRNEYLAKRPTAAHKSLIQCAECGRPCRGLDKAAHCRTCAQRIEDDRLYEAAIRVLGPDATPSQIAAHHSIEKQAKRWVAARRRFEQRLKKTA